MKQLLKNAYTQLKATNILSNFFNLSGIQISNILLLLLIIPVTTRIVGLTQYGLIMFAFRFSTLAGTVINYGTIQSAVRDVAANLHDVKKLSIIFYHTLWIRVLIFTLFLVVVLVLGILQVGYYLFILLSVPMVLAEVFNPLCFFIGLEKLRIFNLYNLLSNVLCVIAILVFIRVPGDAGWVNFLLGMANAITYLGLLIFLATKLKLSFMMPLKNEMLKITKDNFYLTINNISVNLQQSLIIFGLTRWGYTSLLGPYALCDRVIGQCRNLLITISNALYPNTVRVYKQSTAIWNVYRKKTKYLLASVFLVGALVLFIGADFIIIFLSKEHNPNAILFLRIMAFVPVVSALNVLNVLDQLLKNNTLFIFQIAAILLIIAGCLAFILLNAGNTFLIGSFTLLVEICALLMYEYVIKKPAMQNA